MVLLTHRGEWGVGESLTHSLLMYWAQLSQTQGIRGPTQSSSPYAHWSPSPGQPAFIPRKNPDPTSGQFRVRRSRSCRAKSVWTSRVLGWLWWLLGLRGQAGPQVLPPLGGKSTFRAFPSGLPLGFCGFSILLCFLGKNLHFLKILNRWYQPGTSKTPDGTNGNQGFLWRELCPRPSPEAAPVPISWALLNSVFTSSLKTIHFLLFVNNVYWRKFWTIYPEKDSNNMTNLTTQKITLNTFAMFRTNLLMLCMHLSGIYTFSLFRPVWMLSRTNI